MQVFAEHNCNLILFKGCSIDSLGIWNSRACVSNITMSDSVIKHSDNGMFVINYKCVGPKWSSCQILAPYFESFFSFLNLPRAFQWSIPCFGCILSSTHNYVSPTNCDCEEIYPCNRVESPPGGAAPNIKVKNIKQKEGEKGIKKELPWRWGQVEEHDTWKLLKRLVLIA